MRRPSILAALLAAAFCVPTAPHAQETREITFEGNTYTTAADGVELRTYLGREALYLDRAFVWQLDAKFGDGVLEYDVAAPKPSGFVGINWRVADQGNFEQFYLRFHQTGHPDATQYMPVFNGLGAWQIHAGPNEAVATDLPTEQWIHIKIVAQGDKADIYVGDMEAPLIHVPDLYRDFAEGPIALYAADRPEQRNTGAYFSNITMRPLKKGEGVTGGPNDETPPPDGLISSWQVSAPIAEADVATRTNLNGMALDKMTWSALKVERNGIANLARLAGPSQEANTVLVRKTLTAEAAQTQMLRFGYSDRVRLYLNGELLFQGNARWRSRDHRYLGTISWEDQVPLRLKKGDNELVAAVSEDFGGWGFAGALAEAP